MRCDRAALCGFDQMTKLIIFCLNGFRSSVRPHPCTLPSLSTLFSLSSPISPTHPFPLPLSLSLANPLRRCKQLIYADSCLCCVGSRCGMCNNNSNNKRNKASNSNNNNLFELLCLSPKGAINQAKCERTFCVFVSVFFLTVFLRFLAWFFFEAKQTFNCSKLTANVSNIFRLIIINISAVKWTPLTVPPERSAPRWITGQMPRQTAQEFPLETLPDIPTSTDSSTDPCTDSPRQSSLHRLPLSS